jgi:mannose-6-phosphate isomerase-like protein (cupin superfamily)
MTLTVPVRRVVTGKDATGKAVAIIDAVATNVHVRPETGVANTVLWVTDHAPAHLSDANDAGGRKVGIVPPPYGTIFKVIEFAPEKDLTSDYETRLRLVRGLGLAPEGPSREHPRDPGMHRTKTIDYAVILSGEIEMMLDDTNIHLQAGDVVVQRGTNHAWVNRGDQPCRIVFVLVDAID